MLCHNKHIIFTAKENDLILAVAVMPDGTRHTVTNTTQLMVARRMAVAWEDWRGNSLPYSTPADILKQQVGYHV